MSISDTFIITKLFLETTIYSQNIQHLKNLFIIYPNKLYAIFYVKFVA